MIQASDLRIGNLVLLGKKYERVYQIMYDIRNGHSINHADYKEEFFEPIPLTPELLEKCGFKIEVNYGLWLGAPKENGHKTYRCFNDDFAQRVFITITPEENEIYVAIVPDYFDNIDFNHIKHLHQLQNLVFLFFNTELSITI